MPPRLFLGSFRAGTVAVGHESEYKLYSVSRDTRHVSIQHNVWRMRYFMGALSPHACVVCLSSARIVVTEPVRSIHT